MEYNAAIRYNQLKVHTALLIYFKSTLTQNIRQSMRAITIFLT